MTDAGAAAIQAHGTIRAMTEHSTPIEKLPRPIWVKATTIIAAVVLGGGGWLGTNVRQELVETRKQSESNATTLAVIAKELESLNRNFADFKDEQFKPLIERVRDLEKRERP